MLLRGKEIGYDRRKLKNIDILFTEKGYVGPFWTSRTDRRREEMGAILAGRGRRRDTYRKHQNQGSFQGPEFK